MSHFNAFKHAKVQIEKNAHFKHFLNISLGSSFELQTQLLIALQNKYLTEEKAITIENKIIEFQKMIHGFISKLD
ncbi:MAG: four helix bundle protein [Flavobacterium haoranii]